MELIGWVHTNAVMDAAKKYPAGILIGWKANIRIWIRGGSLRICVYEVSSQRKIGSVNFFLEESC